MKALQKISIYALLALAFAASSCKQDDNLGEPDRLFRPVGLSVSASPGIGFCDLTVRWNAMPGVQSYTIEASRDSLQFAEENIFERFVTRDVQHVIPAMRRGERISLRIRSNSDDLEHDSRFLEQTFTVPLEQIFLAVQSGDVRATSITVRYPVGAQATHLKLVNTLTAESDSIPLSQTDIDTGVYRIRPVDGSTDYRVEIYYNEYIRGQRAVKTAYVPSGPNVVFLPDTANLAAELQKTDNIDKILILPEDYECKLTSTITIAGGMTIYGNPDGERAVIEGATGSIFSLGGITSGAVEFVYCNFINNRSDADYMFNMGGVPDFNVSKLSFTNCRMAGFRRNFFRVQGSPNGIVDTLLIDNCEVERMGQNGDYAFMHIAVATVALKNIIVKNSTFNIIGCHFIFFSGAGRTVGCKSVHIENCTFYEMITSSQARWFINLGDSNTNPENSSVTIRHSILGSTQGDRTNNGIHRNNVTLTIVGVYQTNDWNVAAETAVDDADVYNGTAKELFVDPEKGDFSIKDEAFAGKETAGDPRWR